MKSLEEKMWDYIDGLSTQQEREELENLLSQNPLAKQKFEELSALNFDFNDLELEEPSMSFSANIMREINAPLSKQASIDKRIIYAIGGLFGLGMLACLLVVVLSVEWSNSSNFSLDFNLPQLSLSSAISTFIQKYQYLFYGFLIFDLAVLLKFIDVYLNRHKQNY
jgi:anti-sigma factor RsiW